MPPKSGTTNFSLDVDELVEQAFIPLNNEAMSGEDAERTRKTLNLILIELQNKNIPLHKVGRVSIPLVVDQSEYTLTEDIASVLKANLKRGDTETPLARYGYKQYHEIPNKDQSGRPTLYSTERVDDAVVLRVWQVPDKEDDTLELLVGKKIEDVTAAYQRLDIPYKYYPLLVTWLSYKSSLSRPGMPQETIQRLKNELEEIKNDVFEEDRERVDFTITIGGISGW